MSRVVMSAVVILAVSLLFFGAVPGSAQQTNASQPQIKCDPFISGIASFVIPGWGQWMDGEHSKAVTHIAIGLGLSAGTFLFLGTPAGLFSAVGRTIWGLYSTYDAFVTCAHLMGVATPLSGP